MSWIAVLTILVTGFFGPAEFASTAFVHPVIRKLDPDSQLLFEKDFSKHLAASCPSA